MNEPAGKTKTAAPPNAPQPRRRGLPRDRFALRVVLLVGFLVAIVWTLLVADLRQLHARRIEHAQAQAHGVARAMNERVIRSVQVVDQALVGIAQDYKEEHRPLRGAAELAHILRRHAPPLGELFAIGFVNPAGVSIAHTDPALPNGVDHSNREFFRAHVENPDLGLYIEGPGLGLVSGRRQFTLSRRVSDDQGRFVGVVVAPLLADELAAVFDQMRIGPRGSIGLIHTASHRAIARVPGHVATFATPVLFPRYSEEKMRAHKGQITGVSSLDGDERMFVSTAVEGLPLVVNVGISVQDIRAELMRDLAGYGVLALLLTAILVAGGRAILLAHRRELALHDAVAEKDALIAAFFAASPVAMYMLDRDMKFRLANRPLADISGLAVEDAAGRTPREVVPALAPQLEASYREAIAGTGPVDEREVGIPASGPPGQPRYWSLCGFPIRGPQGDLLGTGGVMVEISERKRFEMALLRWQQVFEHADWGVAIGSRDGKTLELVNPAYARMHGYSVEELTGQPLESVFAPEARKGLAAAIEANHALGHVRDESVHLHRDGHTFPVLIDSTTVRDEAGEVFFRVVNVRDISDIRQVEEDLRTAQEFFKTLFDMAPVGMAIADLSGRFVRVNRAWCEFLGYPEEELLWLTIRDVSHPDDLAQNVALRDGLLQGDADTSTYRMEKRYIRKDGGMVWALLVGTMVKDKAGLPVYTIGQMMDIDQRKRMEDDLRRHDAALREALRMGRTGGWEFDAASRELLWSEQLCAIIGRDPACPVVNDAELARYYKPASLAAHQAILELGLSTGIPYWMEAEIVRANGEPGWLVLRGEVVRDGGGKIVGMRGMAQDITVRKEAELALIDVQERLRNLSAYHEAVIEDERKHIAREIHDEMGQLLTALKMDISLLRMRFGGEPELMEKLDDMRTLLDKSIDVVRHVASNLRPAALDLGLLAAVEWLAEDFSHRWEIECVVRQRGSEVSLDDARATAIFRVVQESLTNIARHAGASRIEITLEGHGDRLKLRVRDNGHGFDPQQVRKMPGFGLLGMRERISALGGSLRIDSAIGKGTTVLIDLPVGGNAK